MNAAESTSPDPRMLIGLDFDNTIVRYDGLFHAVAVDQGLISPSVPAAKEQIRDHLRALRREDDWTRLQGLVYGPGMRRAEPYPGVLEFLARCRRTGLDVAIISHRTLHPYVGPRHDLHGWARSWLDAHGVLDPRDIGLPAGRIHFETTKEAKLARIQACQCSHFVDDLPEFLGDHRFPPGVRRILFDPHRTEAPVEPSIQKIRSWDELTELLVLANTR